MLDDNTKDFFFEGFAWKYNEVPRGEKIFWGICMKIELSSEEKKGFCSCHPTWPLWHQMQDTVFVRVILLILITIVPNKIFSYGLKQTMLQTKHIWMKTVYKSKKKNMCFLFLSHLFYGICVKITIMNRSISVYTGKRHGGDSWSKVTLKLWNICK